MDISRSAARQLTSICHPGPAGGTILPGLVDAHVHLQLIDPYALTAGGIAAVDDLGGAPAALQRLTRESDDDRLPVIRYAAAFLTAPGGYPSDRAWAPLGSWREIRSVDDAGHAVAEQLEAGAALIKVTLNSTAGPTLSPPQLHAVIDAAHTAGHAVVAHVEDHPGEHTMLALALESGVDRLAHTPWTTPAGPALLRTAAAQDMIWISTLAIHQGEARRTAIANLRGFLDAGGQVRYGTDLGNGLQPLGVNPAEVRALQSAGMSVDDVLRALTTHDLPADPPPCLIPEGLDRDPARFSHSLATAQVMRA